MNDAYRKSIVRKGKRWWWRIEPGDAIPELMSIYVLYCGACGCPLYEAAWSPLDAPLSFGRDINDHAGERLLCSGCGAWQRIPHES